MESLLNLKDEDKVGFKQWGCCRIWMTKGIGEWSWVLTLSSDCEIKEGFGDRRMR